MNGEKREVQVSRLSRKRLMDIYERLYARFGPQDWWPGETTLEICLGAILVQNTSWANAARAIGNLKREGLLTEGALKKVRGDRLARLIRPARFFNMKAKRVKGFVAYLWKYHEGDVDRFLSLPTKELHEELMGLDGVGRETAYGGGALHVDLDDHVQAPRPGFGHLRPGYAVQLAVYVGPLQQLVVRDHATELFPRYEDVVPAVRLMLPPRPRGGRDGVVVGAGLLFHSSQDGVLAGAGGPGDDHQQ